MDKDTWVTLAVLFFCLCVSMVAQMLIHDEVAFVMRALITSVTQFVLLFVIPSLYILVLVAVIQCARTLLVPKKTC